MTAEARTRHVPLRRCAVCRKVAPQSQLLRLVRQDDGYRLDPGRRLGGRGTWICADCAAEPNEKRLRQAFKGHAQQVRGLLAALPPHTPRTAPGTAGNPASEA